GNCEVLVRSRDEVGICPRLLPHSEVVDEGRITKGCECGITGQSANQPGHRVIELRQIAALTEGEVLCLGTFACVEVLFADAQADRNLAPLLLLLQLLEYLSDLNFRISRYDDVDRIAIWI